MKYWNSEKKTENVEFGNKQAKKRNLEKIQAIFKGS